MNRKFLKDSSVYILGEFINKAFPFFLLPVLTRFLNPADYGILATFSILVSILIIFVGVNVHGAISVNFFKLNKEEFRVYVANTLVILSVSSLVVLSVILVIGDYFDDIFMIPSEWIIAAILIAAFQFVTTVNLLLWTLEKNPKAYALYQIIQSLFVVSLTLVFIIGIGMDWEGQALARVIATILFSSISMLFIIKRGYLKVQLNINHIKDALVFGGPLIPYSLSTWIRNGIDKIFLMTLVGTAATGLYSAGYQVGLLVSIIVGAVNKAWSPYLYKILSSDPDEKEKRRLVFFSYMYSIGLLVLVFALGLLAPLFMPLLVGEQFQNSSEYVFWIALAYAFQGMNYLVSGYLFYQKKTAILAVSNISVAVVHTGLCYYFIINFGPIGAAYSTAISFFLSFVLTWWLSNKIYPMPWNLLVKKVQ